MNFDNILDDNWGFQQTSNDDFAEIIKLKRQAIEEEKKVKAGKIVIWILIALTVIAAFVEAGKYTEPMMILGIYGVVFAIYVTGIIYSAKNAKHAFIGILVVYTLIQLVTMIGNPISIIYGILFKIIFFYFLIQAIIGAGKLETIKERLFNLGAD